MKVLIIGHGYVGSAVSSVFSKAEKVIIDPRINNISIACVSQISFDAVFVCVDTPATNSFKTLDGILELLNKHMKKGTIVCCKSTATPAFYECAEKRYNNIHVIHSPEYLSHHSNIRDFQSQKFAIFGGQHSACIILSKILKPRLRLLKHIEFTDIKTAAFVKYAENGFLSYKITFFNELYNIHKKLNIPVSYERLVELLVLDERIGSSHTQVPGRDGKRGWGGHCFDKDNLQLEKFSKSKLIKFMRNINKQHRAQK
jgi:nucleotide sugar dehydrogenase